MANSWTDTLKGYWASLTRAAGDGVDSLTRMASDVKNDGFGGTLDKLWKGFGNLTKNMGIGGMFGGILGGLAMWFLASLFSGGMVGTLLTLALVPAGVLIGLKQGERFDQGKSTLAAETPVYYPPRPPAYGPPQRQRSVEYSLHGTEHLVFGSRFAGTGNIPQNYTNVPSQGLGGFPPMGRVISTQPVQDVEGLGRGG